MPPGRRPVKVTGFGKHWNALLEMAGFKGKKPEQ